MADLSKVSPESIEGLQLPGENLAGKLQLIIALSSLVANHSPPLNPIACSCACTLQPAHTQLAGVRVGNKDLVLPNIGISVLIINHYF